MADISAPPLQSVQLNNPIDTINGLLGLQRQKQALQTGQYTQQSAAANASNDTRTATEMQNIAAYRKNNPTKKAADMADDISAIAPTVGPDYLAKQVALEQKETELKSSISKLSADNQGLAGGVIGSFVGSPLPNQEIANRIDFATKANPQLAEALGHYKDVLLSGNVPDTDGKNPNPQRDALVNQAAVSLGAKSPLSAGTRNQGTTATPIAINANTATQTPNGPSYDVNQIGQSGTGQAAVIGPRGVSVLPDTTPKAPQQGAGAPRTAAADAPGANAPRAQQEAYATATKAANDHVESVRSADENYGNNVAISNTIRRLSKNANSGPGSQTFNTALAALHTDAGSNAQELGAFLDRQAATIRGQMGLPGTNAGAEDSKAIAGNTNYTPQVIQDKNDYTQAMTEGLHQYRSGLDRVAGFSGQASPKAVNEFKSAWTSNFDPNVYKLDNAQKRVASGEDPDAVKNLLKELAPSEAASLRQKRANLQLLSKGQLPQS